MIGFYIPMEVELWLSFANWAANLLVSITFLSLVGAMSAPATFWLYAFFGVLAFLFSWRLVPETKGRSLEQIEYYWENGYYEDKRLEERTDCLSTTFLER
jgi:hypothetical protein